MKKLIFIFFIFPTLYSFSQWTPQISGTNLFLWNIQFTTPNIGYVIGDNNFFAKTTNGGINWISINTGANASRLFFVNDTIGILYNGDNFYRTTNGGATFTPLFSAGNPVLNAYVVDFPSVNIGYAASTNINDSVTIYKTSDQGATWNYAGYINANVNMIMNIHFATDSIGYLSADFGRIYKTTDGGQTWNLNYTTLSSLEVYDLHFPSPQFGYGVVFTGDIIKTNDGGNSWSETTPPFSPYNLSFILFL